jgi:hypothetical protein
MYELSPDKPPLTPNFILSKVSEEEIFERYLCPVTTKKVCNPLREDRTPTCSFFRGRNGMLMFMDYSGAFLGSCFEVVKYKYSVNFNEALKIIAKDFGIIEGESTRTPLPPTVAITKQPKIIQVKRQPWTETDKAFWRSFGLNSKILKKFNVASCEKVWLNGDIIYSYNKNDPAYVYYFGNGEYKIYYPNRKEYRFIGNSTSIQGLEQLPEKGDFLIITKSLKDVMVFDLFGIPAIAPQAETVNLDPELVNDLKRRFTNIYTLYDFDRTGCRSAFKMWREYGIPMLFLTDGTYGTYDYQAKDISDYIKKFGKEQTEELIKEVYNILL